MREIRKTYRYKLYDSKKKRHLHRQIDMFSDVYNHCIALHKRYYKMFGNTIGKYHLQKHLTKIKKTHKKEWVNLPSQAIQDVTERVDKSYKLFFSNLKSKKRGGTPKFKKQFLYKSFTLKQAGWKLHEDNSVTIGKRTYKYHKSREIPSHAKIKTFTIKRNRLGEIFLFISVTQEEPEIKIKTNRIAGFDFGLKDFLTSSDGQIFSSPQYYKQSLEELKVAHRKVSSKEKGSNNRHKARMNLGRVYRKVEHQRRDYLMKLANVLCMHYDILCFESLDLDAMKRRKNWGRKVNDLAFGEFMLYVQYYCSLYNKRLVRADKYFASTHTCSNCGVKKEKKLSLNDRSWICEHCGTDHHRDLNAAYNLRNLAVNDFIELGHQLSARSETTPYLEGKLNSMMLESHRL